MSWLANRRRGEVSGEHPDIYEGCVTLEFTESVDNNVRPITADNNNVLTYLDYIVIDGVKITPTKNYQHTFGIGDHKIGWKFKSTIIGSNVFAQVSYDLRATDLAHITIPSQITEIEGYAMRGFPARNPFKGLTCFAVIPPVVGTAAIGNLNLTGTIGTNCLFVPAESVDAYKAASGWSSYANGTIAIPMG